MYKPHINPVKGLTVHISGLCTAHAPLYRQNENVENSWEQK